MNQKQKAMGAQNRDLVVRFLLAAWVILMLSFLSLPAQVKETPPQMTTDKAKEPPGTELKPQNGDKDGAEVSQIDRMIDLFTLETTRLVPGATIKVLVDKSKFDGKTWNIDEIALDTTPDEDKENKEGLIAKDVEKPNPKDATANNWETHTLDWNFKEIEGKLYLMAQLPEWESLEKIKKQSKWRGIFVPYKAKLEIKYHRVNSEESLIRCFTLEIPDQGWILLWAIFLSVLLLPFLAWPLTGHFSFKKLALSVKGGRVSISKTQIVIWTVVVLFGIIYVYWISEGFLDITPQILFLLGIGGGTAVTAKYIATKPNQNPAPGEAADAAAGGEAGAAAGGAGGGAADGAAGGAADAAAGGPGGDVAVGVQPAAQPAAEDARAPSDFFKVQMLVFTVVIAGIVAKEIITTNAFPMDLPESYVIVMGISNALYLGNKYQKS